MTGGRAYPVDPDEEAEGPVDSAESPDDDQPILDLHPLSSVWWNKIALVLFDSLIDFSHAEKEESGQRYSKNNSLRATGRPNNLEEDYDWTEEILDVTDPDMDW